MDAVTSATCVRADVAAVAAADVMAAAFVASALSVSFEVVIEPIGTRAMPALVYSLLKLAFGSAVCHDT